MSLTVEQIAEEALALPSEARALLADRLVESLDPSEDGYIQQLWAVESRRRRDDVRSGRVQTIPGEEALERVRLAVIRCELPSVFRLPTGGFHTTSFSCC